MTIGPTTSDRSFSQEPFVWERTASHSPLGLDQERLWLVEQVQPVSNTYNISFGLHIRGQFDAALLAPALARVVERHEALRSILVADEAGRPLAHILSETQIPIVTQDIRSHEVGQRDAALRSAIDRHVQQPFDLGKAPLMRILVIRYDDDSHFIIETAHHAVTDRWSYVRFNQELFGFYRQIAFGVAFTPPSLPLQFFDFAVRQRIWLEENRDRIRRFWSEYLAGAPTRGVLPYDYTKPSTDRRGAHCNFIVDDEVAAGLTQYARKNRMTLNSALIGAYAAVLHERTGHRDIVIGFPSVVRGDPELNNIVGFLLTNIPIRVRIPERPTVASIIKEVRKATAEISGFEDTPYSEIIAAIAPKRTLDEYPLIQTMAFSLEFEEELFDYEAGEISIIEVLDGVSPNDITLGFWKSGERLQGGFEQEGIHGRFEYRTALFHPRTIEQLAARLMEVLADVAGGRADSEVCATPASGGADAVPETEPAAHVPRLGSKRLEHQDSADVIATAWASTLGKRPVHPSDDFFDQGGNSLLAVRLSRHLRESGYSLPVRDIFSDSSLAGMSANVSAIAATRSDRDQRPSSALATPEQLRFLESDLQRPERWAHSLVLECDPSVARERLGSALRATVGCHRTLTARFENNSGTWRMVAGENWHYEVVEAESGIAETIDRHIEKMDLNGPLFCATVIASPKPTLVMSASHLVIDGWSWAVLEQEISSAYRGEGSSPEEADYFDYAAALAELSFDDQLTYWDKQVAGIQPFPGSLDVANKLSAERLSTHHVDGLAGSLVGQAEAIAAVGRALPNAQRPVVVDVVAPGREELPGLAAWDAARAVGNYACIYPLLLPFSDDSLDGNIRAVRDALAAVPLGGRGFGVLRQRHSALSKSAPAVSVNYVGRLTALTSQDESIFVSRRDVSRAKDDKALRSHILNADIGIGSGGVSITWRSNPEILPSEHFERVATAADQILRELVERRAFRVTGGQVALPQSAVNAHFAMLCARGRAARARAHATT